VYHFAEGWQLMLLYQWTGKRKKYHQYILYSTKYCKFTKLHPISIDANIVIQKIERKYKYYGDNVK